MGWLFGNKGNSRTETKTVNDNGKLKELQLTITGPDSTMVVTGDEYRTTVPLRGNQPVSAEEVSIERKAPNGMWLNSLIPFYDGDVKGTQKKARSLWQLPEVEGKSQGGWMNKFQNGGSTQPAQDQVMKELMAIVQQAATELQSNKPGQGVQTLAQIANDPQGSQLLNVLVQQVPEAGQIIEAVMKMVGAYKCGGKAKKKVKKGAKGCVPCKKLMRVGGKLINVLTDCEGNIISKHQAGGWLIPKGGMGLITNRLLNEKYRKEATGAGTDGQFHYYLKDDNQWVGQKWNGNDWEKISDLDQATLQANALNWARGTKNAAGQFENPVNDFFVNGFTWDYDKGSGAFLGNNGDALARTTLGEDVYNQGTVDGRVIRGVQGRSQNNWTSAEPVTALDPTADDYIDQFGVRGAFRRERGRFRDGFKTIRQEKRDALRAARDTRKDAAIENDVLGSTVRQTWRDTAKAGLRQNRADQMAALIDATFNKWGSYADNEIYQAGSGSQYNSLAGFDNRVIANANMRPRKNNESNTVIANNTLLGDQSVESIQPVSKSSVQPLSQASVSFEQASEMPTTNVVKPESANAGSPKNNTTAQTITPEFVNSALTELAYRLSGKQPTVLAASDAASAVPAPAVPAASAPAPVAAPATKPAPAPAAPASTASAATAVTQSSPKTQETNLSTAPTRPVGGLDNYQRPSLVKNGVYATTTPYNVNEAAARVNSTKITVPTWDVQNQSKSVINTPKIGARSQGGWLTKFN